MVRKPNCAGNAPVINEMLSAKRVDNSWPNPVMPSGNEHVVDAVLQIRVLAADVQLTEGILGDAGKRRMVWLKGAFSPCAC